MRQYIKGLGFIFVEITLYKAAIHQTTVRFINVDNVPTHEMTPCDVSDHTVRLSTDGNIHSQINLLYLPRSKQR